MERMLDRAYQKGLTKEGTNDSSKLPKERPEEFNFEMLTDQDTISKYMNDRLTNQNLAPKIYQLGVRYKTKLEFDKHGDKIKKYR